MEQNFVFFVHIHICFDCHEPCYRMIKLLVKPQPKILNIWRWKIICYICMRLTTLYYAKDLKIRLFRRRLCMLEWKRVIMSRHIILHFIPSIFASNKIILMIEILVIETCLAMVWERYSHKIKQCKK